MEPVELTNGHVYLLVDTSVQGGTIWTANKHPELNPTDLFYASLFMGVGGVLALLFTLYPVVIILSDKQMQQTFCYFLLSSCISNTSIVLIIMFYCIPAVVYQIDKTNNLTDFLFPSWVQSFMGGLFLYCYYVSLLSHFLMSFNRFYAIVFHLKYAHIFKKNNVFKMIAGVWLCPIPLFLLLAFQLFGCKYVYREQFTIFSYGLYICSDILQIFDIGFSVFIIASTMIFDLFVAIGLVKRTLRNKTNKTVEVELSFFIQTILTGLVYAASTLLTNVAGHTFTSDNMWKVFFFDQFPKLCAILLIGIFCVTLQKRIREKFKEHFLIFCCLILKDKEVEEFEFVLSRLETSVTSVTSTTDLQRRNTLFSQRNSKEAKESGGPSKTDSKKEK